MTPAGRPDRGRRVGCRAAVVAVRRRWVLGFPRGLPRGRAEHGGRRPPRAVPEPGGLEPVRKVVTRARTTARIAYVQSSRVREGRASSGDGPRLKPQTCL